MLVLHMRGGEQGPPPPPTIGPAGPVSSSSEISLMRAVVCICVAAKSAYIYATVQLNQCSASGALFY